MKRNKQTISTYPETEKQKTLQYFTTKPNLPFIKDMLDRPDYFKKEKGLQARLLWMSPEHYLDECLKHQGSYQQMIFDGSQEYFNQHTAKGEKLNPLMLEYANEWGKTFNQEGRNRAVWAINKGLKLVPVYVIKSSLQSQLAGKNDIDYSKHIWEGWTVQDFVDDLEVMYNFQKDSITQENVKEWCMENQLYYKKYIPGVVKHFKNKLNQNNPEPSKRKQQPAPKHGAPDSQSSNNAAAAVSETVEKEAWEMTSVEFYHNKSIKLEKSIDKGNTNKEKPLFLYEVVAPYKNNRGDDKMLFVTIEKSQGNTLSVMNKLHKKIIQQALSDGKPVPKEVLKDYPELQSKTQQPTTLPNSSDSKEGNKQYKYGDVLEYKRYNSTYHSIYLYPDERNNTHHNLLHHSSIDNTIWLHEKELSLYKSKEDIENAEMFTFNDIDTLTLEGYLEKGSWYRKKGELFVKDGFWRDGSKNQKIAYVEYSDALKRKFDNKYQAKYSKDGNSLLITGNIDEAKEMWVKIERTRYMNKDMEIDTSYFVQNTTSPKSEGNKLPNPEQQDTSQANYDTIGLTNEQINKFVQKLKIKHASGEKLTKSTIKAFANTEFPENTPSDRVLRELTELTQVIKTENIFHYTKNESVKNVLQHLEEFYKTMPVFDYRDSNTSIMQQFSTPIYIAYVMAQYCLQGKNKDTVSVFEPSAGNGLLVSYFNPNQVTVNELDKTRAEILKWQNFKTVLTQDAAKPFAGHEKKYDIVMTNPPFYHQNDDSKGVYYGGFKISTLDQLCSCRALDTMKDDGRAAFIIDGTPGSKLYPHHYWNDNGELISPYRNFMKYIYAYYNVEDVIHLNGHKLYSRQGQATNLRIVLINGRKSTPDIDNLPPKYNPETDILIDSITELHNRVINPVNRQRKAKRSDEADIIGKMQSAFYSGNIAEYEAYKNLLETQYNYIITVKNSKFDMRKSKTVKTVTSQLIYLEVKYLKS